MNLTKILDKYGLVRAKLCPQNGENGAFDGSYAVEFTIPEIGGAPQVVLAKGEDDTPPLQCEWCGQTAHLVTRWEAGVHLTCGEEDCLIDIRRDLRMRSI